MRHITLKSDFSVHLPLSIFNINTGSVETRPFTSWTSYWTMMRFSNTKYWTSALNLCLWYWKYRLVWPFDWLCCLFDVFAVHFAPYLMGLSSMMLIWAVGVRFMWRAHLHNRIPWQRLGQALYHWDTLPPTLNCEFICYFSILLLSRSL